MPRIKAYSGNGHLIPVEDAKVVGAFRCPWTNRVFRTKKNYVNHLKELREYRIRHNIRENIREKIKQDLWSQPDFDSIVNWVATHPEFMLEQAKQNCFANDRLHKVKPEDFWIKITYLDVQFHSRVSNSHACPRNGVRNWGGREKYADGTDKPLGYPGWGGRIEFQTSHDIGFSSRLLEPLGIHTGTGGGHGNNLCGYDVKFFLEDWAGLKAQYVMSALKDDRAAPYRYGKPVYFR